MQPLPPPWKPSTAQRMVCAQVNIQERVTAAKRHHDGQTSTRCIVLQVAARGLATSLTPPDYGSDPGLGPSPTPAPCCCPPPLTPPIIAWP